MPTYNYKAKSSNGQTQTGKLEAKDEKDLALALRKQGYILISARVKKRKGKRGLRLFIFDRVSLSQKLMMTRNLQVMVGAGISLPRCIRTLAKQAKSKSLKKALEQIESDILRGDSFFKAIKKYPRIFSGLFCSMVKVGEETGTLGKSLGILSFHLERSHRLRSKVTGALMYPAVVVVAMVIIGFIMLVKVVPQLSESFDSMGMELPRMTQMVMSLGNALANNWYVFLLLIILLPAAFVFASKRESGKKRIDKALLRTFFISRLVKKMNTAYISRTLSSLISGGVPIVGSLNIASETAGNIFFKRSLQRAAEQVKKGRKISEVIGEFPELYPPVFIHMLQVGEETGQTSEILGKLADFLEEEVTNIAQNLSSVIEPLLLLLIGGVVAFFAISMIQPIYSMMGAM